MSLAAAWSAERYLGFEEDRTRPVRDLLAAVPATACATAIDLGCGPGNSTAMLARRFPQARIDGLDSSPDMITAARTRLPDAGFVLGDIADWGGDGRYDVILSNAALQWVPGHAALLPRLAARRAPGGVLAIQMPDNLGEPAQTLMQEVASGGRWAGRLASASAARTAVERPGWYYALLRPQCPRIDIWRTTYQHVLPGGPDAIVAWFSGTGLLPYLQRLAPDERAEFLALYRALVAVAYPALPDGAVLLAMPRLFIVAG